MAEKIHLIMPMGGKGSRFSNVGFEYPKPLIEINGYPFFWWSVRSIEKFVDVQDIIFVVLQEHVEKFRIDEVIRQYYPQAKIRIIPEVLNGAVLTAMESLACVEDDAPIVFNDCDHMFKSAAFNVFCTKADFEEVDGALLTFESDEDKYGYVKLDDSENVVGTVEKVVVSNDAICGAYYFRNAGMFRGAVEKYLQQCEYKEFFLSGVYNVMAKEGKILKRFRTDFHVPYGVPEEYEIAKESERFKELL